MAESKDTIYFYSSDLSTSRNILLKSAFDQYLALEPVSYAEIEFQPVSQLEVFTKALANKKPLALLIKPELFSVIEAQNKESKLVYKKEFQGLKKNSEVYQKVLLGSKSLSMLSNSTIASASDEKLSKKLIRQMLPELSDKELDSVRFLKVPKDMDAIMSVSFGLADFALSAESSFQVLVDLYKEQYEQMKVLGRSRNLKRYIVVVRRDIDAELLVSLRIAFLNMKSHPLGLHTLGIIGLDEWVDIEVWREKEGRSHD